MPRRLSPLVLRDTSGVHQLPPELLSYIFELACLDYSPFDNDRAEHFLRPFGTETIKPPVVFSGVCKRWRSVAHATGSIWSRICITAELLFSDVPVSQKTLRTDYISSFLRRSQNRPLDIVIDARDPYWDFSEPGMGIGAYSPPFSAAHMSTALMLLLPHIIRWRSLDIMTDIWCTIHAALTAINEHMTSTGASFPRLESLTLMRCNDYTSYASIFEPSLLKTPTFLDVSSALHSCTGKMPLLRNLVLRGVHVDWSSLPSLLPADPTRMRYLELGSHARDVRPNEAEFRGILSVCPALERLSIDGSGPFEMDIPVDSPPPVHQPFTGEEENMPVHLPMLRELCLGYRSVTAGQKLLELLDAPHLHSLTLSDTTNPIDPMDIDASGLLRYLGAGSGRLVPISTMYDSKGLGPFPCLRKLSLTGTKAVFPAIQDIFRNMDKLTRIELHCVSMDFVRALKPSEVVVACPCPLLKVLSLKDIEYFSYEQMEELIKIEESRVAKGARPLTEVHVRIRRGLENLKDGVQTVVEQQGWSERCQVTVPEPIHFPEDDEGWNESSDDSEDETGDSDDDSVEDNLTNGSPSEWDEAWEEHIRVLEGPEESNGKLPARPFSLNTIDGQTYYSTPVQQLVMDVYYMAQTSTNHASFSIS